jgi:hypothetical protein
MTAFDDALGVMFGDPNFGIAASYTAPGGSPVPCTVIIDSRDRDVGGFQGHPMTQGTVIDVRKCEIALPVKGGVFTVGPDSFTITGDPMSRDHDRLVWTCTVD